MIGLGSGLKINSRLHNSRSPVPLLLSLRPLKAAAQGFFSDFIGLGQELSVPEKVDLGGFVEGVDVVRVLLLFKDVV